MAQPEKFDKYKNIVINAVIIIVASVIALNIHKGSLANIASLKAKITEETKKNSELIKIDKLERKILAYKKLLVKREASLVMNDISEIAKSVGIKVLSIKPSQRLTKDEYQKDNFDVSVNALNYDALGKFINKIESFNNIYMVDGMSISRETDPKKSGVIVNLRISSVALADQLQK